MQITLEIEKTAGKEVLIRCAHDQPWTVVKSKTAMVSALFGMLPELAGLVKGDDDGPGDAD